ncbi:MAG: DUF1800 family protein [Betaproteobacteria bacterium]|nr:DUF1800 family protein [Betaproteobacteria bacterium]
MRAWPSHHSMGSKNLLNGTVLPAGQTPEKDLKDALDNLFNHPNVGPFIARRLIQFLVTSNPSPAYIGRVAPGSTTMAGARAATCAVVDAILLDADARDVSGLAGTTFGKQRGSPWCVSSTCCARPMRRPRTAATRSGGWTIRRSSGAEARCWRRRCSISSRRRSPAPDLSHKPDSWRRNSRSPPRRAGGRQLHFFQARDPGSGFRLRRHRPPDLDFQPFVDPANQPAQLVDRLDVLFTAGGMSAVTRTALLDMLAALQAQGPLTQRARARRAALLSSLRPTYVIQK